MIININGKSYKVNSEADIQALMERFDFPFSNNSKPSIWGRIFGYLRVVK